MMQLQMKTQKRIYSS